MVTAWGDKTIKVFDIKSGQEGLVLSSFKMEDDVTALATNGRYIGIALANGEVNINTIWGDNIKKYKHDNKVTQIKMTTSHLASGDEAGVVQLKKIYTDEAFDVKIETEEKLPITAIFIGKSAKEIFIGNTGSVASKWIVGED